jgi:hypothetical protein
MQCVRCVYHDEKMPFLRLLLKQQTQGGIAPAGTRLWEVVLRLLHEIQSSPTVRKRHPAIDALLRGVGQKYKKRIE